MLERFLNILRPKHKDIDIWEKDIRSQNESVFAKQLFNYCEQYAQDSTEWVKDAKYGGKFLAARKANDTWFVRRCYLEGGNFANVYFLYVFAVSRNSEKLRVGSTFVDTDKMYEVGFDVSKLDAPELSDFVKNKDFYTLLRTRNILLEMEELLSRQNL